jgi:hypothetical protein
MNTNNASLYAALVEASLRSQEAASKSLNNIFDRSLQVAADAAAREYTAAAVAYRAARV